eukprot:SAG11_NODE_4766_length_1775_cov_53.880668_1_plen_86_part_10
MLTYLDLLPDDLYRKIYEHVRRPTLELAAIKGKRKQIPKIGQRTNQAVVWHWLNGKPFHSNNMSTDGKSIYSYNLEIGCTGRERKL